MRRGFFTRSILNKHIAFLLVAAITCMWVAWPAQATADETEALTFADTKGALLVEMGSQQEIFLHEADTKQAVAGLLKLPAVLVLCEAADENALDLRMEVAISKRAAGMSGPSAFVESGECIQAAHLMKAAVMVCASDAIAALGEALCGTQAAFVEGINARLQARVDALYTDAVGKGSTLSPRMLAQIGAALMQSECFTSYSKLTIENIPHEDGREMEIVNANKMLRNYAGCTGVATGSSPSDGYCGVFVVDRGGTAFLCVVAGAQNSSTRFSVAEAMLNQAYAIIRTQALCAAGEVLVEGLRVQGGKTRAVNLVAKDTVVLLLDKTEPSLLMVQDIPEQLHAHLQ